MIAVIQRGQCVQFTPLSPPAPAPLRGNPALSGRMCSPVHATGIWPYGPHHKDRDGASNHLPNGHLMNRTRHRIIRTVAAVVTTIALLGVPAAASAEAVVNGISRHL